MTSNLRDSEDALLEHLKQFTSHSVARRLVIQTLDLDEEELEELLTKLRERKDQNEQL